MSDPLRALETWAEPLLSALSRRERLSLATAIGRELRRSTDARVARQIDAEGRPFVPRRRLRDRRGEIRRNAGRLFQRLTKSQFLRVDATPDAVAVGFVGRVARIARVHQEGLIDRVSPRGPSVRYARRPTIGLSTDQIDTIRGMIAKHFAP